MLLLASFAVPIPFRPSSEHSRSRRDMSFPANIFAFHIASILSKKKTHTYNTFETIGPNWLDQPTKWLGWLRAGPANQAYEERLCTGASDLDM